MSQYKTKQNNNDDNNKMNLINHCNEADVENIFNINKEWMNECDFLLCSTSNQTNKQILMNIL